MLLLLIFIIFFTVCCFKLYIKLTTGIAKCSRHLVGKVVLVTGGNSGIGYETAKDLADRGAKVIIACRNEGRGTTARDKIIAATDNQDVHYRNLDLASLASVRKFADEFIKTEQRLDILVNNAGVAEGVKTKSEDGLNTTMQINHYGPFLLTNLLLPLLKSSTPSRIINVSSIAYYGAGNFDLNNLNMEREPTRFSKLYAYSKLANILMVIELKRILEGTGVTANALHPGLVNTSFTDGIKNPWIRSLSLLLFKYIGKNSWEGAQTTIYLAVSPEVKDVSGRYFSDCKEKKLKPFARDPVLARKFWEASERLVKFNQN